MPLLVFITAILNIVDGTRVRCRFARSITRRRGRNLLFAIIIYAAVVAIVVV